LHVGLAVGLQIETTTSLRSALTKGVAGQSAPAPAPEHAASNALEQRAECTAGLMLPARETARLTGFLT